MADYASRNTGDLRQIVSLKIFRLLQLRGRNQKHLSLLLMSDVPVSAYPLLPNRCEELAIKRSAFHMHTFTISGNILDIIQMIHIFFTIDHLSPYELVISTEFEEFLGGKLFKLWRFRQTKWQQQLSASKKDTDISI